MISEKLLKIFQSDNSDIECTVVMVQLLVQKMAQRVAYGQKARDADVFHDQNDLALWRWEIFSIDEFFEATNVQLIKELRLLRKRVGNLIKSLVKLILMFR